MRKRLSLSSHNTRNELSMFLAVCWFCGLLCGIFYFWVCNDSVIPLMHRMVLCPASIVVVLSIFIPFLLTSFLVAISEVWAIFAICFFKSFLFSFVSIGCLTTFGSGGWLLRYLLLFCDCVVLPALLWYWMWSVSAPFRACHLATAIVFAVLILLIVALDYRIIAPFVCLIDSMKG